jgi:hypothetical protein
MSTPYTYLIGWPSLDTWYYGCRYAIDCNPLDLWNPYKTSSKHVEQFIKEHGDPEVVQIRKIFTDREKAILWEHNVLRRLNVIHKNNWLNRTDNKAIVNPIEEQISRAKSMGKSNKGRVLSEETKLKMSLAKKGKKGIPHTKEVKLKISASKKSKPLSEVHKENISKSLSGQNNPMFGKKRPDLTEYNLNRKQKSRDIFILP